MKTKNENLRTALLNTGKAGVEPAQAEIDACRIEHVISDESFEAIKGNWEKQRPK